MAGHEHHHPARHALAADPTLSLLRWSAGQRLAAVSIALVALWALVTATIS